MKWYFKVLRHYADFSGRARRKEYWMALLFNIIFALAWTLLLMLVYRNSHEIAMTACQIYYAAILLPSLAVIIRRLHDVGKSGWMLLIVFIPIVGVIWLLVLLLKKGQQGVNQYGHDPKSSSEMFDEQSKLKSVGVTFTAIFAGLILINIVNIMKNGIAVISEAVWNFGFADSLIKTMWSVEFASYMIFMTAGIFILCKKTKNAIIMMLVATSVSLILDIFLVSITFWHDEFIIHTIYNLSILLFIASILFLSQNKSIIRSIAMLTISFSILYVLWNVHRFNVNVLNQVFLFDISIISKIIIPIAFIVLAGTSLQNRRQVIYE